VLKDREYQSYALKITTMIDTLIEQRNEENLLFAFSLSLNVGIKKILQENNIWGVYLNNIVSDLSIYTPLDNVWINILSSDGKSRYSSFTQDNDNQFSMKKMRHFMKNPEIKSFIEVWKFNIVSRVMIPVYDENRCIGAVESILLYDNISETLEKKGYQNIMIIPNQSHINSTIYNLPRLAEYYVTQNNTGLLRSIKTFDIHTILQNNYSIDDKHNLFYTKYAVLNYKKSVVGYFILAYPLDKIDLSHVKQIIWMLYMLLLFVLFLIFALGYYFYTRYYKKFIISQQKLLETKVKEKTKVLRYMALHDGLTKLPNRTHLLQSTEEIINQAHDTSLSFYVLFLDLDRFKEVNDTYGHNIGDELLKKVSDRLLTLLDENDIVGRVSGDEFIIILENKTQSSLENFLHRIINAMQAKFDVQELELFVTFSIGISHFPTEGSSAKELFRKADTAMYHAKEKGKNRYQFYDNAMTQQVIEKQELGRDLRFALERNEFEIYYQPKIHSLTGKILGLEGLIRWNHPQKGLMLPSEFLHLAEEIGLIVKIDEYVRIEAFKQILKWHDLGIKTGVLSLNLSTRELEDPSFLQRLDELLYRTKFNAKYLEFEILENQIMQNKDDSIVVLNALKERGISVAIDDFGTGYSSLSYLQKLPVDKLKIDRSFIIKLDNDKNSLEIVRMIMALSKTIGVDVVAEGVENKMQSDILSQEGCYNIQGYYFSKPLSAMQCQTFLLSCATRDA
jgi:diguanylate cyclase (GGDEF)-like protein